MWQKNNDERQLAHCLIKRIDRKLGTIVLQPREFCFEESFNKRLSLYFKGDEQSILFKEQIHFASGQLLVLNIPREIKIIEKRENPRTTFDFSDDNLIWVSKYEDDMSHPRNFELILLDLSLGGIAFNISGQQAGSIKKGDLIFISRILDEELETPLIAEVKYARPARYREKETVRKGIRVGAQFKDDNAASTLSHMI